MKSTTWPLAAALALAMGGLVQAAPNPIGYTAPDGVNAVAVTAASPLPVTGPTTGVPTGGVYTTSQAVATTGAPQQFQTDNRGRQEVTICSPNTSGDGSTICVAAGAPSDGFGASNTRLDVNSRTALSGVSNQLYVMHDVANGSNVGTGSGAVAYVPHSAAAGANLPYATPAVASSLVLKSAAGNMYSWKVTSGASAGYVMVFNATSAPADGAVTPADCTVIAANSTVSAGPFSIPERYSNGITIVFSTTGCFTKTASSTAYIRGSAQ